MLQVRKINGLPIPVSVYITGFTYDNVNTLYIYDNSGNTFSTSINVLSASTVSATTFNGVGNTYIQSDDTININANNVLFGQQIQLPSSTAGTISTNVLQFDGDTPVQKFDLQPLTGTSSVNITNMKEGNTYIMIFIQGSGLYNVTLPSGWWLNDTAPFDFSTLADNERVMITMTYLDNEYYYAVKQLTFA